MARTAVGPFSLNSSQDLDRRIIAFFDGARNRGKSDLFRKVMIAYFDATGGMPAVVVDHGHGRSADLDAEILERIDTLIAMIGNDRSQLRASIASRAEIDMAVSKDKAKIIKAERLLDQLAL